MRWVNFVLEKFMLIDKIVHTFGKANFTVMKNIQIVVSVCILFFAITIANAGTDCTPRPGGGYSCYDYDRGTFIDVIPKPGGGYRTYDYGNGTFGDITPKPGRGYSTYDYGTGNFGDITPRPGGGYNTYDYGTGEFGTILPHPGGGFSIDKY